MINQEQLKKEMEYLNLTVNTLDSHLELLNNAIYQSEKDLKETSEYISNNFYDMDSQEQASSKDALEKMQLSVIALINKKNLTERQKQSAYFGRVDFKADDESEKNAYYIGISHILKKDTRLPLVIDWRAPLSSIYYDFEVGRVNYIAPFGDISGEVFLKRQYKTKVRELVYAFDSNLTIDDEILKQTLGGNADGKMKNIVATIQKAQNKIIREDESVNLLVQGVAGSGKTSIALHRVAYLMYKNKISSKDILIISPSSLFSDYINDVLPELGEQNTLKMTFDEIANNELNGYVQFEPKSQMLEDLVNGNKVRANEVQYKSGFEFYERLKNYLNDVVSVSFCARDIKVGEKTITKEQITKLYTENYGNKQPSRRIEWIADYIVDQLDIHRQNEKAVFSRIKKVLFGMFENVEILTIYQQFLSTVSLNFNKVQTDKTNVFIGYEDMPAIFYIKDFLLGVEIQNQFKYVIIDEMQDYSPIIFELLCKIFPSPKTILGDINQTFEKQLDEKYLDNLAKLIGNTKITKLLTTYRSTLQIATYNQNIINLNGVINFNRSGEEVSKLKNNANMLVKLENIISSLEKKYNNVAIICPSIKESEKLFESLKDKIKITLIDETSGEANEKLSIIPAVYTKGLEFDAVIYISADNKKVDYIHKNIKYIACTRALHSLTVFE